jgi:hypothetical protein
VKIAWRLLPKRAGFRMLMDVVPLGASLVRGSHGRRPARQEEWPLLISSRRDLMREPVLNSIEVFDLLRRHVSP